MRRHLVPKITYYEKISKHSVLGLQFKHNVKASGALVYSA